MNVIVIGGGIVGASIAWQLAEKRIEVTVLERGRIGREASWAAAGLVAPQAEIDRPGPLFDLCVAGKRALDRIAPRLIEVSGVDPEYDREGVLWLAFDEAELEQLRARSDWNRAEGGVVDELSPSEARKLAPAVSDRIVAGFHLPDNWRVNNRNLMLAYAAAATRAGAEFREGVSVDAIAIRGGRASGAIIHDGSILEADAVINAAGAWAGGIGGIEADAVRLFPVRGQILCFDAAVATIRPSLICAGAILVPRRDGRILAGSVFERAGFDRSVTLGAVSHIAARACRMVPALSGIRFREAWAGLRPAADDLEPVLGASPSITNLFYACGHYRSGILLSAITGEIIADLVTGRPPAVDLEPFSPARFGRMGTAAI